MTESRPYAGLTEKVIFENYSKGEFSETESLGFAGSIIKKSREGEYKECKQVVGDLKAARQRLLSPSSLRRAPRRVSLAAHRTCCYCCHCRRCLGSCQVQVITEPLAIVK
ncbi:uncharacterized protein P884DRAFT_953 [Thermothelomyces heterothallicus CBS 202.75]|uniref:uncharacterized protein n=1 Tax=Thermothelomyces heterothallicus CBS 202.75 TaxID=1149848 RepID=UPI0037445E2D